MDLRYSNFFFMIAVKIIHNIRKWFAMSHNTPPLNRQDYKTLTLAALGGALEFYDFIIFVFFAALW